MRDKTYSSPVGKLHSFAKELTLLDLDYRGSSSLQGGMTRVKESPHVRRNQGKTLVVRERAEARTLLE